MFPEQAVPDAADPAGPVNAGGVPNRVVLLAGQGTGRRVAVQAAEAVRDVWAGWVRQAFGERDGAEPGTRGSPT